jgi:hypothetical protein
VALWRRRTEAMQPSPLPYPSDDASKVLDRPLGDSAPRAAMWMNVLASSIKLTAAAMAVVTSPFKRARLPRCVATSEDEHAVSIPMQGPAASAYAPRFKSSSGRCLTILLCRYKLPSFHGACQERPVSDVIRWDLS